MTTEYNDKLQKARNAIYHMSDLQNKYNQQYELLQKDRSNYNDEKRCPLGILGLLIVIFGTMFGFIPLGTVIYAIVGYEWSTRHTLLILLISLVLPFLILFVSVKIVKHLIFRRRQKTIYKKNADILTTNMDSINNSIIEFYNTGFKPALMIPPKYRYPLAIEYIIECFENDRADNIRDAVNLYEQQIHNWRVENYLDQLKLMQWQQRIALQNIEYISRVTAAAAATSAFNSFR